MKTIYEIEDDSRYYRYFSLDVNYLDGYDEESFVWLQYYLIEWIKVRSRYYEVQVGKLVLKRLWIMLKKNL